MAIKTVTTELNGLEVALLHESVRARLGQLRRNKHNKGFLEDLLRKMEGLMDELWKEDLLALTGVSTNEKV
jgi:hypothetical protein